MNAERLRTLANLLDETSGMHRSAAARFRAGTDPVVAAETLEMIADKTGELAGLIRLGYGAQKPLDVHFADELRKLGYHVRFKHERRYVPGDMPTPGYMTVGRAKTGVMITCTPHILSATGGRCTAEIWNADRSKKLAEATVVCSDLDNYNKRVGRLKSIAEAAAKLSQAAGHDVLHARS